tara:strand:+ start:370 stop:669 length:300 start_codon:yes stop_codon:yes gene_type:complete
MAKWKEIQKASPKVIAGVAVDTAVPIPEHRVQYNAKWYDLAKDMDIGDSVVLNYTGRQMFRTALIKAGFGQVSRTAPEFGTLGERLYRCWKTKKTGAKT